MAMKFRTTTYTIVRADGSLQKLVVPQIMGDCHDVAAKLPHSMVFMHLAKGYSVYAKNGLTAEDSLVTGPAIIFADADGLRVRTELPTDDHHAGQIWRTYIAPRRKAA